MAKIWWKLSWNQKALQREVESETDAPVLPTHFTDKTAERLVLTPYSQQQKAHFYQMFYHPENSFSVVNIILCIL